MRSTHTTLLVLVCLTTAGCTPSNDTAPLDKAIVNGDAGRGLAILSDGAFGCAACHEIPGVPVPRGTVGPSLVGLAERGFLAGQLPNKPDILIAFLLDPASLVPETGMPNVGMTPHQARDIASYLYTLGPPDAF